MGRDQAGRNSMLLLGLLSGKDFSDSSKDVVAIFSERKVQAPNDCINRDAVWKILNKICRLHVYAHWSVDVDTSEEFCEYRCCCFHDGHLNL